MLIQFLLFIGHDILNKKILYGYQKSARGGEVECELDEENHRVLLRGYAVTVMKGHFLFSSDEISLN